MTDKETKKAENEQTERLIREQREKDGKTSFTRWVNEERKKRK